jgi:hypothetical protein
MSGNIRASKRARVCSSFMADDYPIKRDTGIR